jgi:hypothetical protein
MILTFGYQGRLLPMFLEMIRDLRAVVVDIRARPYSRAVAWNRARLEGALGRSYRWEGSRLGGLLPGVVSPLHGVAPDPGTNPRDYEWKWDPSALSWLVENGDEEKGDWLVLLCACHAPGECHRHQLAMALAARGVTVHHIFGDRVTEAPELERAIREFEADEDLKEEIECRRLSDVMAFRELLLTEKDSAKPPAEPAEPEALAAAEKRARKRR